MLDYKAIFTQKGLTYSDYRQLVNELLDKGETTGSDHSESMLHYSKMNVQRMNRVEKTAVINPEVEEVISALKHTYHLLIITEGWCGDAAQIVPVINKMAELNPATFDLKLVLRDQHLDLIDAHLTNGGRAIPILLVLDSEFKLLAKWGPRPAVVQSALVQWKKEHTEMMEIATLLHGWYAKDKTVAIQHELLALLNELKAREITGSTNN